jgi:hypothetical protein
MRRHVDPRNLNFFEKINSCAFESINLQVLSLKPSNCTRKLRSYWIARRCRSMLLSIAFSATRSAGTVATCKGYCSLYAPSLLSLSGITIDPKLVVFEVADNHSMFCWSGTRSVSNARVMAFCAAETELMTNHEYEFLQANKFVLTCISNDFNSGSSEKLFNDFFISLSCAMSTSASLWNSAWKGALQKDISCLFSPSTCAAV